MDTQGNTSTRVADKAKAAAEKKDLSGTSLNASNSFAILDDDDIIARALEMGVNQCSLPLEKVHYLKDLEIARHSIKEMQEK
jgi:2-C-methyl-D-erythritol 4-phosphate cytidylyltransferase